MALSSVSVIGNALRFWTVNTQPVCSRGAAGHPGPTKGRGTRPAARREQARQERERRQRRLRMLSGVVLAAIAIVAVAIAVSSGGGGGAPPACRRAPSRPPPTPPCRSSWTGSPKTEHGRQPEGAGHPDLLRGSRVPRVPGLHAQRRLAAAGAERGPPGQGQGRLQAFQTATPNHTRSRPSRSPRSPPASRTGSGTTCELFYRQQGQEGPGYVTESYLDGLAEQVPGLDFNEWKTARNDQALLAQVQGGRADRDQRRRRQRDTDADRQGPQG